MITVHHLDTSRSERIVWPLEELGLPYRIERYARGPDRLAPDAESGMARVRRNARDGVATEPVNRLMLASRRVSATA